MTNNFVHKNFRDLVLYLVTKVERDQVQSVRDMERKAAVNAPSFVSIPTFL